ncbi:MAG: hypothetical protein ACP5U2_07830 [Bryobacteraceae bacterium]
MSLQPGGFFEYIAIRRSSRTGTGIQTPFAEAPLATGPGEWEGSPAHSRLWLQASIQAKGNWLVYYESDFLQPPGHSPYRLRQFWGEYECGGWRLLGGQAWSLLRPNRAGISSENDLMNTLVVEPGYHVGLAGKRTRQLRLTRDAGAWHVAAAYEHDGGAAMTLKLARDAGRGHWEIEALGGEGKRLALGLAAVAPIGRRLKWVSQQLWSQGAGPLLVGAMPARVHAHSAIQGLEATLPAARVQLFAYGGVAWAGRCEANRLLRQWSVGAHRELFQHARWGATVVSAEYSRLERFPWAGGRGAMHILSFRLRHSLPSSRNGKSAR